FISAGAHLRRKVRFDLLNEKARVGRLVNGRTSWTVELGEINSQFAVGYFRLDSLVDGAELSTGLGEDIKSIENFDTFDGHVELTLIDSTVVSFGEHDGHFVITINYWELSVGSAVTVDEVDI